jgi:ribosomal protein L37AE/L43A
MDSKKLMDKESRTVFKAVEDFETKGKTKECCPRCKGKLKYYRAGNSFSISCENQCGFVYNFRGL